MKRSLIIILIMTIIIPIIIPIVSNAGLRDEVAGEASDRVESGGTTPIEPEIPSGPETSPNDPIQEDPYITSHTVEIPVLCSISGNVWEDLKNFDEESGTYTRNNKLDNNERGTLNQDNIRLEIRKEGSDQVYATPSIGSDGSYSFTASEEGNYYVRMYYGLLDDNEATYNDTNKVKKVLKYNGQDYICSKAGTDKTIDLSYREEIIKSGKGCTQIYLALDCSKSMVTNETNGVTRLESEIKVAKKLIDELIEDNENNIYIGIVAFGEYPYKIQGLTKSKERLYEKLDQALNDAKNTDYYAGSTDIRSVLYGIRNNKTKQFTDNGTLVYNDEEYFVNTDRNNSNRYVFLLSDGIPLSDGTTVVYNDDSDQTIRDKIQTIVGTTREEINAILNDGIYESVLITKTGDEEVDGYVNEMCNVNNLEKYLVNIENAVSTIAESVKEHILRTTISENTSSTGIAVSAGLEDSTRRAEITNNYNIIFDNQEAGKFLILDNYNSQNSEDREKAKEISEKAYCFADTSTYHLYPEGYRREVKKENGVNPDGSTYTITYVEVANANADETDIVLTQRDNFMIEPIINVTAVRVTLPDGRVYKNDIDETAKFIDTDLQTGTVNRIVGVPSPIVYYIDSEVTHGTKVDIEYTIALKNTSPVISSDMSIVVYLPKGFSVNGEQGLMTVNYTNSNYGWNHGNTSDLIDNKLVVNSEEGQQTTCAVMSLSTAVNNGLVRNTTIGMNGERYIKLIASKIITNKSAEENENYKGKVEILQYTNPVGRRMQYSDTKTTGAEYIPLKTVVPGTYSEEDYTASEGVIIIPPTGIVNNHSIIIITCIIICSIIIVVKIKNKNTKN